MKATIFKKSTLATAVSAALLVSVPSTSFAAEEAEEARSNEVITVTATRRSKTVQEIPFNISAISGADIESAGIVDANELLRALPGISVPDAGARAADNNNAITIRGLNVSASGTDAVFLTDPTVSTYVNDTPTFSNFILKDIERVEVLRGPQGTLYGSGSLGGTVRYILNKPDITEFEGTVDVSYGNTSGSSGNNISAYTMLNIPLTDDMAIRFNVGKIDNDGVIDYVNAYQVDNNGVPDAAGGDYVFGAPITEAKKDADTVEVNYQRFSFLYEPSDDFSLLFNYMNQEVETGGRRAVTNGINNATGEDYGRFELGAALLEPSESDNEVTSLELEYNLGFATLSSSSSISDRSYSQVADNTGFQITNGFAFYYGYGNFPRLAMGAERDNTEESFTQELRLVSNSVDSKIDWTVGVYYQNQDSTAKQSTQIRGFTDWWVAANQDPASGYIGVDCLGGTFFCFDLQNNPAESFRWDYANDFEDKALFGEATYHFSDKLEATIGFRSFSNESTVTSQTLLPIWGAAADGQFGHNPEVNDTNKDSDTLFKVNISYSVTDDLMFYGTISEGYRRGGSNAVPIRDGEDAAAQASARSPNDKEWLTFEQDTVTNYEIGVKGSREGFRYTANLFFVDWSNPQINTSTPSDSYFAVVNGDGAETKGLETEFIWSLTEFVALSGGYTYVSAELTEDLLTHDSTYLTTGKSTLIALAGDSLPGTAKNMLNLALTSSHDLTDEYYLANRIGYYYQSETENAIQTVGRPGDQFQETLSGFGIWNANFTLVADVWTVGLAVKNMFNEKGVTGTFKDEYMGANGAFYNFDGSGQKDFIAQPRTVTLYASYNF
jgi:iron complex outermembrane receptor protein